MSIDQFIAKWTDCEGGAERSNAVPYMMELLVALDLPTPDPAGPATRQNDYAFERSVCSSMLQDGPSRRIDLYRRGCFVMEHKQSRLGDGPKAGPFDGTTAPEEPYKRAGRGWDVMMRNARRQALGYVGELPADHVTPPFIIICDVARNFEVWADFSGSGRAYTPFPDRNRFRFSHADLCRPDIQERLRAIWLDPASLNPAAVAAQVTREIADELATISRSLEARGHDPGHVAQFVMRCVFTAFAADVGLLPKDRLIVLLEDCVRNPGRFAPMLRDLWISLNAPHPEDRFFSGFGERVPYINGRLFEDATTYALEPDEISALLRATRRCWRKVEPAIFGSLLEHALGSQDRRKFGAHYTPRAFVVRLVDMTIMEPLREAWLSVQTQAEQARDDGERAKAVSLVRAFHQRLTMTRVLDPACGTGNFLYVALELIKTLEADVLELLTDMGQTDVLDLAVVDPHQFLGLEVNPRAAIIAEVVLWIGFLQQHYRSNTGHPSEPILRAHGNIVWQDALVDWDGGPRPIFAYVDGVARQHWPNARPAAWPEAEFIIGNPPFLGGKDLRGRLDPGYAEQLWRLYPQMNESADLVMYWWDRAAALVTQTGSPVERFGFVTTNSISQVFQRRTIERWLAAASPLSLTHAVPDHPWTCATDDAAAVRISMTVARAGVHAGQILTVLSERGLDTDEPQLEVSSVEGRVNADLTVGADVTAAGALKANAGLCSPGAKLHGAGFLIERPAARDLGLGVRPGMGAYLRPYRNGRDIAARSRNLIALDFTGVSASELRDQYPEVYQHLADQVRVPRAAQFERSPTADARVYLDQWWLFGKTRPDLREALDGLPRYIATVETAKHRVFQFLDAAILADNMLICVADDDAATLAILSSDIHRRWAIKAGGWLGVGNDPRYTKSRCFDPFPFPNLDATTRHALRMVGETLDAHRKAVLEAQPDLTLTGLYNVLQRIRSGEPLNARDIEVKRRGLVGVLADIHHELDDLAADAYGWPTDLRDDALMARLVALNEERALEEGRGQVRWLRPAYQSPRAKSAPAAQPSLILKTSPAPAASQQPVFPANAYEQPLAVQAALRSFKRAVSVDDLLRYFGRGYDARRRRIRQVLATLYRYGHIDRLDDDLWVATA